jgi:coenzyme F420-reducing hydrogenase delta subunit
MQYPATIKPIRVPCAGRVSPDLIIRALRRADAVLVVG